MNQSQHFRARFMSTVRLALVTLILALGSKTSLAQQDVSPSGGNEPQFRWEYFEPIEVPKQAQSELVDFILGPSVFDKARIDLGDLRVFAGANRSVPYSLRILRPEFRRTPFPGDEFNRAEGPNQSTVLTFDLKRNDVEHNEVEIKTPGNNFRRRVEVEGSEDGEQWATLAATDLINFQRGKEAIEGPTVAYPPSRFRFLRVRVFPDPDVDQEPVSIDAVSVVYKVEVPGELLTLDGELGQREPTRGDGGPGSAWIITLGGNNVPCDRIEVEIDDSEFVRNYYIEAGGPPDSLQRFYRVGPTSPGVWQRRAGESAKTMLATFQEVRATRLRLVVTDFSNPPLSIRSVKFSAPARQIVLAREEAKGEARLFFGNPEAQAPNYDFARNLPDRLDPPPARAMLAARDTNPRFVPPPQPLTERWPWLIYVVLGSVSLILGLVIANVARRTIAIHDAVQSAPDSKPGN